MSTLKPGLHNISMQEYLALDALSVGPLRTLVDQCELAAWIESRQQNPDYENEESEKLDIGTIAHSVFLEGSAANVAVIDPALYPAKTTGSIPTGWTNAAIKAARDNARAEGKVPVLLRHMDAINDMVQIAREFINSCEQSEPAIFDMFQPGGGMSEVTMVWQEGETWCKARADRLSNDNRVIVDYKSCAGSVEPTRWARTNLAGLGNYLSASWYRRGMHRLTGILPEYVFLAQETTAPAHLCALIGLDASWLALGDEKVEYALRRWQRCVKNKVFAGYPTRVCYPDPPAWERAQWDGRLPDVSDEPRGIVQP